MFNRVLSFFRPQAAPAQAQSQDALDASRSTRHREDKAYRRSFPTDEERNVSPWAAEKTRLECRDLARNSPLVNAILGCLERNVVGPEGMTPQARTANQDWNTAAEGVFRERAKIMDYRGRLNLAGLQRLSVFTRPTDGNVFFVMTDTGQLQPIEAERIGTPPKLQSDGNIINGCQLDSEGRTLGWYVCTRSKSGGLDRQDYEFVEARDMIHLASPFRFDQIFGHPDLAAVVNKIKDKEDFDISTLLTARLQSRNSIVIKTEQGAARASNLGAKDATGDTEQKRVKEEFDGYTQKIFVKPGESSENIPNPTPGPQFVGFDEHLAQEICSRFGLPYDVVSMNFHKGSFAQSKAALVMAYKTIEAWQIWLRDALMQRLWNWTIARAIRDGLLPPAPVDERGFSTWYLVDWIFPGREWIDPKDAIDAEMAEFRMGKTTLSAITAKTGRDWEAQLEQKAKELQAATELEKRYKLAPGTLINAFTNAQAPIENNGRPPNKDNANEP